MAEAIESLIAWGHSSADVWSYTPKRIAGFLHYAQARQKREAARDLGINSMAARSDPRDINKKLKELGKE